jgi:putative spermidine/putrescine transport system permease protein
VASVDRAAWPRRIQTGAAGALGLLITAPALTVFVLAFSSSNFLTLDIGMPSLRWFVTATSGNWPGAISTSIVLAALSAIVAGVCGSLAAAYRVYGGDRTLGAALDLAVLAVFIMPPISLAVGYFRLFGEGSVGALLLGHSVLALPFPYLIVSVGLRSVGPEILQAAQLTGASDLEIIRRILLPAVKRFCWMGLVLAFLSSWDETVLAVFLTHPGTVTLPKAIWESMQRERDLTSAAINAITSPILAACIVHSFRRLPTARALPASR